MSDAAPATPADHREGPASVALRGVVAFAIAIAIAATYRAGPRLTGAPASIDVPASAMQAAKGRTHIDGKTLVLDAVGADGVGLIAASMPPFASADYTRATWDLPSSPQGLDLVMVWNTRERPGRSFSAPLTWARGRASIDFAGRADWSGSIQGVALAVRGGLPAPLVVAGFTVRSNAWDVTLTDLVRQWFEGPARSGRAVTSQFSHEADHIAPMLTVVALGIAIGFAWLVLRARRRKTAIAPWAIAALFLAGWLALDLRWQLALWRQHASTVASFAGKSQDEKYASDVDAPIFEVARRIRDADRPRPARILVLSDNMHLRMRVGWFLYPENVFYYDGNPSPRAKVPAPDQLLRGDQVVLLLYPAIRWDRDARKLVWADGRMRAGREILSDGPDFALVEVE